MTKETVTFFRADLGESGKGRDVIASGRISLGLEDDFVDDDECDEDGDEGGEGGEFAQVVDNGNRMSPKVRWFEHSGGSVAGEKVGD